MEYNPKNGVLKLVTNDKDIISQILSILGDYEEALIAGKKDRVVGEFEDGTKIYAGLNFFYWRETPRR